MLPLFSRAEFERTVVEHRSERHAPDWVCDPDRPGDTESKFASPLERTRTTVARASSSATAKGTSGCARSSSHWSAPQGILELYAMTFELETAIITPQKEAK